MTTQEIREAQDRMSGQERRLIDIEWRLLQLEENGLEAQQQTPWTDFWEDAIIRASREDNS